MQSGASKALALRCAPVLALLAGSAAHADYATGFSWNRLAEWKPGTENGELVNNPGPDAEGAPVWSYEAVQGGALGSGQDWYAQPGTLLTWDSVWWESGQSAWSLGDEANPPVFADRMTHNVGKHGFPHMPLLRWTNPAGDGAALAVTGSLMVTWSGHEFVGAETDVDVAIARMYADGTLAELLLGTTVSKPTAGLSVGDSLEIPLGLDVLLMDGESLVFTLRGRDMLGPTGRWVILNDSNVTLTLVPAPAAAGLLGLAGVAAMRRRSAEPRAQARGFPRRDE